MKDKPQIRTYKVKLQNLSKEKVEKLNRLFLEAKWFYNWLIEDINRINGQINKVSSVEVQVSSNREKRDLIILCAQCKQGIAKRIQESLRALKALKDKGYKVGKLTFKNFVRSIPLPQFKITYDIDFTRNKIRLPKVGWIRVLGLRQLNNIDVVDFGQALLLKKASGFYLHITCYVLPQEPKKIDKAIGIDFGIGSKLTLSNGITIDFEVGETERLKRLQKVLSRKQKESKKWLKIKTAIQREHERIANIRQDIINKVVAFCKIFSKVVFQDNTIKTWAKHFGRQVYQSAIGGIKSRMSAVLETLVVDRFETTTNECFACGKKHSLSLRDRTLKCECGWTCSRDLNAALVILKKGLGLEPIKPVGLDRPELTSLERTASARILGSNPYIRVSYASLKGEVLLG